LPSLKEWIKDGKDLSKIVTTKVETIMSGGMSPVSVIFTYGYHEDKDGRSWPVAKDIESWDVSNWTNMSGLFYTTYVDADLSGWDVSKVTMMGLSMQLGDVDININNWDVSNVTSMTRIFFGTTLSNYIEGMDLS
jgi:hypothetical protein